MGGVVGVIQARLGSSRLPGKILAPILDRPLLAHVADRVRGAQVDQWWLATSDTKDDDITAAWGVQLGLRVARGPLEDVLARFLLVTREARPDWLVRVTTDEPFTDADVIDRLLAAARAMPEGADVVGDDPDRPSFPRGFVPQVARGGVLERIDAEVPVDQPYHRSHVLSWLYACGRARFLSLPSGWPARPAWRWTIDTAADLEMVRAAFAVAGDGPPLDYPGWVQLLDSHPEIPALNADVRQKRVEES